MLIEQTLDKLSAMRLGAMADAVEKRLGTHEDAALSFEERLGLLVDTESAFAASSSRGTSVVRCRAKRSASSSGGGASIRRPSWATSRPQSDARPCSLNSPSLQRSRTARPVCKTACTCSAQRLWG